ncbi:MAG: 2Fe-2S iron-sulfur cluster binding domain-containing protein [Proteobacteria bacterium]|nr:2Fe-2S iron-sulfur cluster binding domain-containing protein [Pseudomonadota bacterium]
MHILTRGDIPQRIRLISGLILFLFALTHFLNTAIGLVDLPTMDLVDSYRVLVIRSLPGTIILATALVVHIVFGLYKLARRTSFRMPWWEAVQILLGVLIPFLLFPHIVNTRIASHYFNVETNYLYELARLWPDSAILQSTLLVIVWIHGCMGLHFWLRLHGPYRALQPVLLFLAIMIPLASLAGFMVSGKAVASLIQDPAQLASVKALTRWPNAADADQIATYRVWVRLGFLGVLGLVAAIFGLRYLSWLSSPKVQIRYAGGPTVNVPIGPTLLEMSRLNKVPHASVCGGRARCSTCRVRIEEGAENLPPAVFPESVTLAAIEAPANVRLACQIRPAKPLVVTRLLRPVGTGPEAAGVPESDSSGTEKPLAVLYVNMREFNELTRTKLAYDVVFLLNQFFTTVATAIRSQGGLVDKFIGDGVIAVFGQKHGVESGARQALRAVRAIDLALDHLNSIISPELGRAVRVASGLHAGHLILGRIGHGVAVDLTVIGPAVKTALDLATVAKERDVQLVLSLDVAQLAGWSPEDDMVTSVAVSGLDEPLSVVDVPRGRDLAVTILAPAQGEKTPRVGEPTEVS